MPKRYPSGFISAFYNPLENPNAPTIGTVTGGDTIASVPFTAPSSPYGAITGYGVQSTPEGIQASGSSSPISVTGLTNGTAYTFAVWALNSYGPSAFSAASNSVTPAQSQRGLIAGGTSGINVISYIEISTTGNSIDFGDLYSGTYQTSSMSNITRAVVAGGYLPDSSAATNILQYVTIASTGNSIDFGDLSGARRLLSQGSVNNTTRGLVAGGYLSSIASRIHSITIGTTGDSTDFGSLSLARTGPSGCSSPTRGVFAGGEGSGGTIGTMDYVTTASFGNAANFGTLSPPVDGASGCSNATRGLFAQGYDVNGTTFYNSISYITIASTGNSTDFGDCSTASRGSSSMSSSTRAVINAGSSGYPYSSNVMEYVTIATTGNTTDFGDLTESAGERTACSAANGGVQ